MNDTSFGDRSISIDNLFNNINRGFLRKTFFLFNPLSQVALFTEFSHNIYTVFSLDDRFDFNNIGHILKFVKGIYL